MARGVRILLKNVCYHVTNRGNQKNKLFIEDADYEVYLRLMKHYKRRYCYKLFGYCLMPTHPHLIIEPKAPKDLPVIMQCLTQTYTRYFNKKYKTFGHLWQGRFKNMIIQKDAYFIECIYYFEMNPVRAGLVNSPAQYRWSSYQERVLGKKSKLLDLPDST